MAKIYYDCDIELDTLENLKFAIIGYGNQGRAHALNLKESGLSVEVGARPGGRAYESASADGFDPQSIEALATNCDVLVILVPDEQIASVYERQIEPYLTDGKVIVFAHGFAVRHKTVRIPEFADLLLIAPTGPGRQLRELYTNGKGLPALVAVGQDFSGLAFKRCLAYAKAIGCTRAGVIETSFEEETVTDLFCEQAVLCGGIPELIKASFTTLVENGYQPELAYISCLKEVKLIADLLFEHGISGMRSAISTTAQFGSAVTGPRLVNPNTTAQLVKTLRHIESGEFAKAMIREADNGSPEIKSFLASEKHSRLARVGQNLKEALDF